MAMPWVEMLTLCDDFPNETVIEPEKPPPPRVSDKQAIRGAAETKQYRWGQPQCRWYFNA